MYAVCDSPSSFVCDPQIEALWKRHQASLDLAERERLVKQIQRIVLDEHYFVPIYWNPFVHAVGPRVLPEGEGFHRYWDTLNAPVPVAVGGLEVKGGPVVKKYILVRALYSVVTLWLLVTIIFGLVRLTGDPVAMKAEAGADAAYVAQLRQNWGLDQPLYRQYLSFIGRLLRADFGHSFEKSLPVRDIYFERLPNSLSFGFTAFLISIVLGVPFGMLSALKVNSWWDHAGKLVALFGLSMPGFFVGLVLIMVFGIGLGWLPVLGKGRAPSSGAPRRRG